MELGPFWKTILGFMTPFTPYFRDVLPFDPLISFFILGLLAFLILRGHRRYELLRRETEDLLRRYIVFRGKKHGILREAQADKKTHEEILRSVSRSWHNFKEYHAQKIGLLKDNYQAMKKGLLIGGVVLVLNTVRVGLTGLLITGHPSGFFSALFHDLPHYFLVVVGAVLLRVQGGGVRRASPHHTDPAVATLFGEFDGNDPLLYEEFDPFEGEKREE